MREIEGWKSSVSQRGDTSDTLAVMHTAGFVHQRGEKMNGSTSQWMMAAAVVAGVMVVPAVCWACTMPPDYITYTSFSTSDAEPPEEAAFPEQPVAVEAGEISRGESTRFWEESTMCNSRATGEWVVRAVGYELELAGDEGEGAEYGLLFEVEGTYPESFEPPSEPIVPLVHDREETDEDDEHDFVFRWSDADSHAEPIDVTVNATWVDPYGRKGPTSEPVHIVHDGDGLGSGCGCQSSGGTVLPAGVAVALLGLLAMVVSRRGMCKQEEIRR